MLFPPPPRRREVQRAAGNIVAMSSERPDARTSAPTHTAEEGESSIGAAELPARKRAAAASAAASAASVQDMAEVEAMMACLGLKPMAFVRAAAADDPPREAEQEQDAEGRPGLGAPPLVSNAGLGFGGTDVLRGAETVYDRSVDGEH